MKLTEAEKKLYDLGLNKKKETPKYIYYFYQSDCDKSDRGAIIFDKKKLKIQAMYAWKPAGLKAAIHERWKELGWGWNYTDVDHPNYKTKKEKTK